MEQPDAWYGNIKRTLEGIKTAIDASEIKEYHLDRLDRLARHIGGFGTCSECCGFKPEVEKLVDELRNAGRMNKEQRRSYLGRMERMVSHLQKKHRLISEGQNLAIWLSIGTALGLALGAAFSSTAIGIPVGLALGVAIGSALDAQAKKEGRVI